MKKHSLIAAALIFALLFAASSARAVLPSDSPAQAEENAPADRAQETAHEETDKLREIMKGMTIEEKAWQMIMVYPEDITGSETLTDLEVIADALNRCPVGGFCLSGSNMESVQQLKSLTQNIRAASNIGAFIALDEEGGKVARLSYNLGATTDFLPMFTYRDEGTATAYENALTIGRDIADFGFNLDFAPVADVWTNPENTVIAQRAYSSDAAQAAALVAHAVRGFRDAGVIATLKHFPGHGNTAEDSHYTSAYSAKTIDELRECEFLPFVSGMEAGAGMVMTAHIILNKIDPENPATFSKTIITDILRGELGWKGVVITDAFEMDALAGYTQEEAVTSAIEAGCDIILCPDDPEAAMRTIVDNFSPERIDESVYRILSLKMQNGIIS